MRKSDFDLVIFDYDGVVADSELLNNTVLVDLLNGIGLPTTLDYSLKTYLGKRWADIRELISDRLGSPCPAHLQDDWLHHCHLRLETDLRPVEGFEHFLGRRSESVCIASSSPPNWIEPGLTQFGAMETFAGKVYSGSVHVTRGKPHPDLFLYAADDMKVVPQRSVVIEDSPAGVIGAAAAGMTVLGLCAGGHIRDGHADRLKAAGAHHVFESYDQIEDWLTG